QGSSGPFAPSLPPESAVPSEPSDPSEPLAPSDPAASSSVTSSTEQHSSVLLLPASESSVPPLVAVVSVTGSESLSSVASTVVETSPEGAPEAAARPSCDGSSLPAVALEASLLVASSSSSADCAADSCGSLAADIGVAHGSWTPWSAAFASWLKDTSRPATAVASDVDGTASTSDETSPPSSSVSSPATVEDPAEPESHISNVTSSVPDSVAALPPATPFTLAP